MDSKIMYGVWLPGEGWLKVDNRPVAFEFLEVAISTTERIGRNSRPEYIDNALVDLEKQLLDAEILRLKSQENKKLSVKFKKKLKIILDFLNGEQGGENAVS